MRGWPRRSKPPRWLTPDLAAAVAGMHTAMKYRSAHALKIAPLTILWATALTPALLGSPAAHADALGELRATLSKLPAPANLNARLTVTSTTTSKNVNGGKPVSGAATIEIQADPGLSLHFAPALLAQGYAESRATQTNADAPTPVLTLLRDALQPLHVADLIEAGKYLLTATAGATTATAKATTLYGAPVRELTMALPQPKSADSKVKLKDFSDQVSVWLNADGVPVAYSEASSGEGCLLFLCIHANEQQSATFAMIGGCLVMTARTTERKQSGLGRDSDTRSVYTLAVQQADCKPASGVPSTPPSATSGTGRPATTAVRSAGTADP